MIDVVATLQESETLREGQLANDVECEVSKPLSKVKRVRSGKGGDGGCDEALIELVAEDAHGGVDVRLKGYERAHRVSAGDRFLEHPVDTLVLGSKDAWQGLPIWFHEKSTVEIGLVLS